MTATALDQQFQLSDRIVQNPDFTIPFPALTPAQRIHLDVYGYVVVEKTLTAVEVENVLADMYDIRGRAMRKEPLPRGMIVNDYSGFSEHYTRIDNLPHLSPRFFDYLTHPRLVAMAQEAVGMDVRLEQSDAHIIHPDTFTQYGFHRGPINFGWSQGHLYQFPFVKTLTNLTDLGPDDGGTTVIPGSHKMPRELEKEIIAAALADHSLIRQVVAPAGSTMLMYESTIHSGGIVKSGRERSFIIGGYTAAMMSVWPGYEPNPEFLALLPKKYRDFLTGEASWLCSGKPRTLSQPSIYA
jgi:ectoine hydroxylase-related dioxygenase (phytanoyl-CoA dioxygenase family)